MTKPRPSRTYNPLHFEDLEPHRFEDMVRQLIYDFRDWVDIQAVGRSGADKGVDIRAIEQVGSPVISDPDEDEGEYQENLLSGERREWIFQCKRYSQINPKKLVSIVNEDLSQQEQPPYAYVVVAACNFSSTAREEFRREMVERQIKEFYLWGKAELEDRLYQPKNDHLLFAYFGISIQARKRSQLTQLRSDLTLKKRLIKTLGDIQGDHMKHVLIRDPNDLEYPGIENVPDSPSHLPWNYWYFKHHLPRNALLFEVGRAFAFVNWQTEEWDYIKGSLACDGAPQYLHPFSHPSQGEAEGWRSRRDYWGYWQNNVPNENQAQFILLGRIPYDRIVLVDDVGDIANEEPHLLIDFLPGRNLIEKTFGTKLFETLETTQSYSNRSIAPDEAKRIKFFPDEIPEEVYKPPEV